MRLPTPFVKLPLAFDAQQLVAEALQFDEHEWRKHPQDFAGNTALILISHGGTDNDDSGGCMAPTSRLQRCPYITQVFASFNTVIGRSRLMRLAPGAEVTPHSDIAYYWHDHTRIHIPIVTDPGVRFICDGIDVHMAAGEAWIFDNWRQHQVLNHTNTTRIHLVIDTVGSAAFWRLVSQGTLISARSNATNGAHEPRLIRYEANNRIFPTIEQHNLDAIVHPDTVLAIVQELIADLRQSNSAHARYAQLELLLVDFAHNWRSLWAAYGTSPDGNGAYQELLQHTLQQASQGFSDVRLASNGMPLVQILQSYLPAFLSAPVEIKPVLKIPRFDRPIIILAAPRSGSTLLYETLAQHPDIWALGNESHAEIENLPGLSPKDRAFESNALDSQDATPQIAEAIRKAFTEKIQDHNGSKYALLSSSHQPESLRFLEKTPKNALRVAFIDALFPDAYFIFLHRDPRPNLASMIDAWQSGKFITYPKLPGWRGLPWSLLLTPGWQHLPIEDLAVIVAQQWCTANTAILDSLQRLPDERWCSVTYEEFIASPADITRKLYRFCNLSPVEPTGAQELPLSRHTLTPPSQDKWRRHEQDIERVLDPVMRVESRINQLCHPLR
jgi:Sulfotransferase family/Aspartyl/Asparaginyl beta-hydroxylase